MFFAHHLLLDIVNVTKYLLLLLCYWISGTWNELKNSTGKIVETNLWKSSFILI